jgi:hypothetical protein
VRIRGVRIPAAHLRWAAVGTGVVVLASLVAVLVGVSGLFGAAREDQGGEVRATVVAGVTCDRAGATETVTFTAGGKDHRARFDGCGHAKGEEVDVTVPTGPLPPDLVVHAADAAVGDSRDGEGLGLLLIAVSGMAGAAYAFVLRARAWPGQETSSAGDSQVLHW